MKKIIFGIFAHPDDEAFGPAGALLQETRDGTELHLITLTNGGSGTNLDNLSNLGEVRLEEWRTAGKLLGAKTMHHFGYSDGHLNNTDMIEIGKQIVGLVGATLETAPPDTTVEFMTLDLNGYTGHIDHIVAARAACFAFYTLKQTDSRLKRIRFACLPQQIASKANVDWLYMEAGRTPKEIQETVDARSLRESILEVMHAHRSQQADCQTTIKAQGANLGLNYFTVKS